MVLRPRRATLVLAALAVTLLAACGEKAAEMAVPSDAHIFAHQPSGVGIELPAVRAGRYRTADTITIPANGLERQLSLRLVRGDSSLVDEPMLVIRVFSNAGWQGYAPDSANMWFGSVVAQDGARTVAVRPAPGNPLTAGQPDALAFDSLMIAMLGRQMKASLRATER
jgi:hypothetical protein